jgi:hypothetical protein
MRYRFFSFRPYPIFPRSSGLFGIHPFSLPHCPYNPLAGSTVDFNVLPETHSGLVNGFSCVIMPRFTVAAFRPLPCSVRFDGDFPPPLCPLSYTVSPLWDLVIVAG